MSKTVITITSALGFIVGAAIATLLDPTGPRLEPEREPTGALASTSDGSTSAADVTDTGALLDVPPEGRAPSYCDAFPERCNIDAPCSQPKTLPDGSVTGGCFAAEYVCCDPDTGCWAVHWASDCKHYLYWTDCEAGESAIDPDSGQAIIICHD